MAAVIGEFWLTLIVNVLSDV